MEGFIAFINGLSSVGTVALEAASVLLLIGLLAKDRSRVFRFFANKSLIFIFLVSFGSLVLSLVYSNIIGFEPCILCWYQRVFIYSIAVVSAVALIKKYSKEAFAYIGVLATGGLVFAIYHVYSQGVGKELIPCPATGPSCLKSLVNGFGYIDIPVMSLSALVFIILLVINRRRFQTSHRST